MKDVIWEMEVSADSAYRRQCGGQTYYIRFLNPAIANHSGCGDELQFGFCDQQWVQTEKRETMKRVRSS